MRRLLEAKPPVALSSWRQKVRSEQAINEIVDVLVFGDSGVLFAVGVGGSAAGCLGHVFFPSKAVGGCDGYNLTHEDGGCEFVRELRRVANLEVRGRDRVEGTKCPVCSSCEPCCGIAAASTVHVDGLHAALFFALECDCLVLASFALSVETSAPEVVDGFTGKASLISARWFSNDMSGLAVVPSTSRQNHVPISAVVGFECEGSSETSPSPFALPRCSSFHSRMQGRPTSVGSYNRSCKERLAVLRIAFVRKWAWVEYVEITWWERGVGNVEGCEAHHWRELCGFNRVSTGSLSIEIADWGGDSSAAVGEVRALHWLPRSYDYKGQNPLLAVIHERAHVKGDPLVDTMSIFMLLLHRQKLQKGAADSGDGGSWSGSREKISGTCENGPWRVEALTLAHPSFLLHVHDALLGNAQSGRCFPSPAEGIGDVLGVFLRPAHVMYPSSSFLRRGNSYTAWEPMAREVVGDCEEKEDFYFVLYSECGEVAKCPVGGFIESASSCAVEPLGGKRLSGAGAQSVVAVVVAVRSGGTLLFLEVMSRTSALNGRGKGTCGDAVTMLNVVARVVNVCGPLEHPRELLSLHWDGSGGTVMVFTAQCEPVRSGLKDPHKGEIKEICCRLVRAQLLVKDRGTVNMNYWESLQDASAGGQKGAGCIWSRTGIPPMLQFSGETDTCYGVGAVRAADFGALCRCTLPPPIVGCDAILVEEQVMGGEEIVLFRSGGIFLYRHFLAEPNSEFYTVGNGCGGSYQWLSDVRWPPSENRELNGALTLLFSSAPADICMAALWNAIVVDDQSVMSKDTISGVVSGVNLLFACWSTVIVMTAEGNVVWVSDLCTSQVAGEVPFSSLVVCTLRPFAQRNDSHFVLLSASTVPSVCEEVSSQNFNSVLLLLQLQWFPSQPAGEHKRAISVSVVDIRWLTTEGRPLFTVVPSTRFQVRATLKLPEGVVSRQMLCCVDTIYCSNGVLCAVTCALLFVSSTEGVSLLARFLSVDAHRGHCGSNGGGHPIVDLRRAVEDECQLDAAPFFLQPILIQCVLLPAGDHRGCVIVVSFLSGLTVLVAPHTRLRGWLDLQLVSIPTNDVTAVNKGGCKSMSSTAPFVRLQKAPPAAGTGKGSVFCALDALGRCWVVCSELIGEMSQGDTEAECYGRESLEVCLKVLESQTQRLLGDACPSGGTSQRVVVTRGSSGPFTFSPAT